MKSSSIEIQLSEISSFVEIPDEPPCYIQILGISMDVDYCIYSIVVECGVPLMYMCMYEIIKLFLLLLSLSLLSECSYTSLGST